MEARASAALHALYRLIAYHKQHADVLAGTGPHPNLCCGCAVQIHAQLVVSCADIVSVIARALKSEGSLSFKTHACYVLNTLATNCFVSHKNLVASGVLPCLVDSLTIRG